MFATFFHELKQAGLPVTLREYLTLMEAMERDLAGRRVEDFYYLSRAALVKDERNLDKFDRVFGHVFEGLDLIAQRGHVKFKTCRHDCSPLNAAMALGILRCPGQEGQGGGITALRDARPGVPT